MSFIPSTLYCPALSSDVFITEYQCEVIFLSCPTVGHAFISKDKIARTPEKEKEPVVTKLFLEEGGSGEVIFLSVLCSPS